MTSREVVLQMAETGNAGAFTPAAFFLHFPPDCHRGRAAIEKHVEYFRATGNDIMKVQYESHYPRRPELRVPRDWKDIPCYGMDFYADQVNVVDGVVDELGREAVVIVTLYSAYMFASHFTGWELLDRHMQEDPAAVAAGLEIITESMSTFIRACVDAGVDGFYASSQGGEPGRFSNDALFDEYIRPFEMQVWDEIDSLARLNVLHVCDYEKPYRDLKRFVDYPGQIVSAPTHLVPGQVTGAEISEMFARPFMGGMERLGTLSVGSVEEVEAEARLALEAGPRAMILGADCTLSADAPWANIRAATAAAHSYKS